MCSLLISNGNNFPLFLFVFSGATKLEEAADLYVRAANQFKIGKDFEGKLIIIGCGSDVHIYCM